MDAKNIAMFRFLLEAEENLAFFTTLEKRPALLKLVFAEESRESVISLLNDIKRAIYLEWEEWPLKAQKQGPDGAVEIFYGD